MDPLLLITLQKSFNMAVLFQPSIVLKPDQPASFSSVYIGLADCKAWSLHNPCCEPILRKWLLKWNARIYDSLLEGVNSIKCSLDSQLVHEFVKQLVMFYALLSQMLLNIFMQFSGLLMSFILSIYILQSSRDKLARYSSCVYHMKLKPLYYQLWT